MTVSRNAIDVFFGKELKDIFRKEVLEPLREEAEALVHTLPLELGVVNTLDSLNAYGATVRIQGNAIRIEPEPGLATQIEEGEPPWDVAQTMLSTSSNVKVGEDGGRYMDVPLNSGSGTGSQPRHPIWFQGQRDQIAERTRRAILGGDDGRGKALKELRDQVVKDVKSEVLLRHGRKDLRSRRHTDTTAKVRRISEDTNWIHPGFDPLPILRTIEREINAKLQELIGDYL